MAETKPATVGTQPGAISFRDFTYTYAGAADPALVGLNLEVEPGEFIVLAGPSGSGKSTLLRAACGLIPHFHGGKVSGEAAVGGRDLREAGPAELSDLVGYVAQDAEAHVVSTTVRAELELPLELRGEAHAARARAVEEVALALAIPELLSRTTDTLSGGELQRVALAAALVTRPSLILLDEPTSQLDPIAGDELISLLRRLNEEWGTAVLLCEHRLERCLTAADRVIAMADGTIGFDGSASQMLSWARLNDPALLTPGARMWLFAGLDEELGGDIPVGVKRTRTRLAEADLLSAPAQADDAATASPTAAANGDDVLLTIKALGVVLNRGEQIDQVLTGIDLELRTGERVALMGRNGAGKSTLLRCLAGLIDPAAGRIKRPSQVALLGQRAEDFLINERLDSELPGEAGAAALEMVGLGGFGRSDPRDLSGGQRQRAALAVTMAGRSNKGSVICLDEPTRGLDRLDKEELALRAAGWAEAGAAVLICTHDVEFAASFADRVILMGEGEIVADGPMAEILAGGWYFATEVARVLGLDGIVSPEQGAELIGERRDAR